jgi:uncharacterized protein YbjT (DUF2867 family)
MPGTKAEGEAAVLRHMPDAVILRPSIIFGPEDQFFNRFARMARLGPVLPVVGAATRFQPVYVDDVAECGRHGRGERRRRASMNLAGRTSTASAS